MKCSVENESECSGKRVCTGVRLPAQLHEQEWKVGGQGHSDSNPLPFPSERDPRVGRELRPHTYRVEESSWSREAGAQGGACALGAPTRKMQSQRLTWCSLMQGPRSLCWSLEPLLPQPKCLLCTLGVEQER